MEKYIKIKYIYNINKIINRSKGKKKYSNILLSRKTITLRRILNSQDLILVLKYLKDIRIDKRYY